MNCSALMKRTELLLQKFPQYTTGFVTFTDEKGRVYKTAVRDTADLEQHFIETWSSIPQTVIDKAIEEWGL